MHPIERLRYVARSQGAPAEVLVSESAVALGAFRDDPAGMVAACRRIIDRHLTCGPLWWLCATMLCSPESMADGRRAAEALQDDPTGALLASELPIDATVTVVGWPEQAAAALRRRGDLEVLVVDSDGESDEVARQLGHLDVDAVALAGRNVAAAVQASQLVLVDALAVGPTSVLAPAGSAAAAGVAHAHGVPVWVVAGVGRLMPATMFDAMVDRWSQGVDPLVAAEEVVPLAWADRIAGVGGVLEVGAALAHTDCPVAPELLRLAG